MQFNALDQQVRPACQAHGDQSVSAFAHKVDVSQVAMAIVLSGSITMDPEAFGVAVSRRPGAEQGQLTGYERSRLLDVLCHAKAVMSHCQELGAEKEFVQWLVSSDARDSSARAHLLAVRREAAGGYHIRLSDV